MVPDSSEIKWVYPLIKDLAIYWSAQKRSWFVSCRCNAVEAEGIKEMYANSISVNNVK
jgi:hypothetical protein